MSRPEARLLTLDRLFERSFSRHPDQVAITTDGESIEYRTLDERSAMLANVYRKLDLTAQDRGAILMENRSEFLVAQIGALRANVTVVPLNNQLADDEVHTLLELAQPSTVVVDSKFHEILDGAQQEIDSLSYIIGCGSDRELPMGFHRWAEMLDRAHSEPPSVAARPDDIAAVYYTSGTTGQPKEIRHTHRSLVLNTYAHLQEMDIRPGEQMLLVTPLAHSAEPFARAGLAQGGTLSLQRGFDAETVVQTLGEEGITWTYLVPSMITELLETVEDSDAGEELNTLAYGAAPISQSVLERGIKQFGRVFVQFYGLTEVPNLITVLPKQEHDPDDDTALQSAGYPCQLVELTLIGLEEEWAGPDIGEIAVRSPYAMSGYGGQVEDSYDEGGWLRTGDVGRIDSEGRVHLLDRLQNVIVQDGKPVYSTLVENAIQRHPGISQVGVIGVPKDSERGTDTDQTVKAVVVPNDGAEVDLESLQDCCVEELDCELPDSLDIVGELPETPYGKIDKQALREPYW